MQNRYAGDVGDFGKLGMLRALAQSDLKVGVNWYLVPDENHNDDGKHIGYLAAFARRELHAVAPPVADGSHPSRNPQTAQGAGARAADSIKRTVERHGLDVD